MNIFVSVWPSKCLFLELSQHKPKLLHLRRVYKQKRWILIHASIWRLKPFFQQLWVRGVHFKCNTEVRVFFTITIIAGWSLRGSLVVVYDNWQLYKGEGDLNGCRINRLLLQHVMCNSFIDGTLYKWNCTVRNPAWLLLIDPGMIAGGIDWTVKVILP